MPSYSRTYIMWPYPPPPEETSERLPEPETPDRIIETPSVRGERPRRFGCGCSIELTNIFGETITRIGCEDCGYCENCCGRVECAECSEYTHNDEFCESCGIERSYSGGIDCSDDGERQDHIRDYAANVVNVLGVDVDESIRNYGMELEVELEDISANGFAGLVHDHPVLRDKWIVKHDGSLSSNGVELVSIPMPYQEMHDALDELWRLSNLKEYAKSWPNNKTCGTHIHVSRESMTPRTIGREWAIWARGDHNPDMKKLLRAFAGRYSNGYAEWNCVAPIELFNSSANVETGKPARRNEWPYNSRKKKMGAWRFNDHYAALSCSTKHPTFEKRVFCGASRASTAQRFLECFDMFLNIAEETHGIEVLIKPEKLLLEIGKRLNQYPAIKATFNDPRKLLHAYHDMLGLAEKPLPKSKSDMDKRKKRAARPVRIGRDLPRNAKGFKHVNKLATRTMPATTTFLGDYNDSVPMETVREEDFCTNVDFRVRVLALLGFTVDESDVRDRLELLCENPNDCSMCRDSLETTRVTIVDELWERYVLPVERQLCNTYVDVWRDHSLTPMHLANSEDSGSSWRCGCWGIRRTEFQDALVATPFYGTEGG